MRISGEVGQSAAFPTKKEPPKNLLDLPSGEFSNTSPSTKRKAVVKFTFATLAFPLDADCCAEIRNRIYDFATEQDDYLNWQKPVPFVAHNSPSERPKQWPMDPSSPSARKFFGLTQVCKQIRAEYRPIWLQQSSVRVFLRDHLDYIDTFHGGMGGHKHMPQLIQISWLNGDDKRVELTGLFSIRAHSNGTRIEMISHVLHQHEKHLANCSGCEFCGHIWTEIEIVLDYPESWETELEPHELLACYKNETMVIIYPYLVTLNTLFEYGNPNWLRDIKSKEILEVWVDDLDYSHPPTVWFRFDPRNSLFNTEEYGDLNPNAKTSWLTIRGFLPRGTEMKPVLWFY